MSFPSVTIPADSDEKSMQRFLQDAQSASKVICDTESAARGHWFTRVSMPSIQHFSYTGCRHFEQGEKVFAAMPNLIGLSYFPVRKTFPQNAKIIQGLDRSGLWERLEFLYVRQLPISSPFAESIRWPDLWKGRNLNFVEMNLSFGNPRDALVVLQANLPRLERLSISPCLGEEVLETILSSKLPSLQYLDLRFNSISPTALTCFAKAMTLRGSPLKEVSIDLYDNERIEHYDWNGAVVESFNSPLFGDDITRLYLTGTGLKAVQGRTLYF